MKTFISTVVAVGAIHAATTAQAAVVNISSISASWQQAVNEPGSGDNFTHIDDDPAVVSWGDPATTAGKSDYTFDPLGLGQQHSPFILGTFTHNNQPVFEAVLQSVDLHLTVKGNLQDQSFEFSTIIAFEHEETFNTGSCLYGNDGNGCFDRVTIANLPLTEAVELEAGTLTFSLSGFAEALGAQPVSFFNTAENAANESYFVAAFDFDPVTPSPVPLPAAGWMLIAGIGGLVAMKRRQKARA